MFLAPDLMKALLRRLVLVLKKVLTMTQVSAVQSARQPSAEDEVMFLIDDLLAAPLHGLLFVLKKIDQAVQEEVAADERAIMAELSALHRALDTGAITQADFDAREQVLLQRLDRLRGEDGTNANGEAHS